MRILFLAAMMTMPAGLCAQAQNDECGTATIAVLGSNAIDTRLPVYPSMKPAFANLLVSHQFTEICLTAY